MSVVGEAPTSSEGMDEVKVYHGEEEDEIEAPSLADDRRDVAMEEEMDTKFIRELALSLI